MNGFSAVISLTLSVITVLREPVAVRATLYFLSGVFLISGISKIRRPELVAMSMVDFGIADAVHPRFGRGFGALELMLAVMLVPSGLWSGRLSWLTPTAVAMLLWSFVVLLARSLISGHRFPCHCFGNDESALSGWTLGRTIVLAGAATLAALETRTTGANPGAAEAILELICAMAALSVVGLGQRLGGLLRWNQQSRGQRAVQL